MREEADKREESCRSGGRKDRMLPAFGRFRAQLKESRFAGKFFRDYGARTVFFACFSAAFNVAYVCFNAVTAAVYRSVWYSCMTAYYFLLGFIRIGILLSGHLAVRRHEEDGAALRRAKWNIHLGCGIALFVLEAALSVVVAHSAFANDATRTGTVIAIASAAYTFYKLAVAVVNLVRAKRFRDPVVQSLRGLNFTDALVSLLSLQVTMLAVFGSGASVGANTLTGAAVCLVTVFLGVVMIARAVKHRKEAFHEQTRPEEL